MRAPQSAELRAELERWGWMPAAWSDLPAESRRNYDDWVLQGRSARASARRARAVARRCYSGRPWAGRPRRTLQALHDYVFRSDDLPHPHDGTMVG
jgi:hypothetical protein